MLIANPCATPTRHSWRPVSLLLAVLCLLAIVLAQPALALPITSGTGSYITFRDCSVPGPCDSGEIEQRAEEFTVAGASAASGSNAALGNGSASASFGAVVGAPVLTASASSTADGRLGATAIAVQSYQNTSAASVTAFFGGDLTFNLTDVAAVPTVFTGIEVQLAIFTTPTGFIDVADSLDRFAIFDLFTWQDLPGVTPIYDSGLVQYTTSTLPGAPIALTTPGIVVAPGESFFVLARLLAIGAEGSTADASNTLVTGLYDSMDLESRELLGEQSGVVAVQAIPSPGSAMLVMLGLVSLRMRRARRRSQA